MFLRVTGQQYFSVLEPNELLLAVSNHSWHQGLEIKVSKTDFFKLI